MDSVHLMMADIYMEIHSLILDFLGEIGDGHGRRSQIQIITH